MASTKPITTKIINSSETCVDDNLLGMVAAFPLLHLHPKHRVITVRLKADTGKVALIGGGGSGHEPFAGGFVGAGMLSGAVAGAIFASPPTGNMLYAIKYLYKYNSGGLFVLIGNYAGDRLNFGKAIEKAKIAGVKVEGIIAGEDIASSSNKIGGRGMLSEVMIYKMCGALADRGADLATIKRLAEESLQYMGTLGVCLNPCSLPGQPPLFEIPHGQMEWGAGLHGEAGIAKVKVGTASEVVGLILDEIIKYLKLVSGDRVVAMINNLGGTTILEMNILSKEIKEYLGSKNISTERLYYGHLKSSLEMQGFQIFLLQLQKESGDYWLELLDEPTNAPGWPGGEASVKRDGGIGDDESVLLTEGVRGAAGPSLTVQEQDILLKSLTAAANEAQANEALLNRLDSGCGDGDCGNTFARFGKAVIEYLKNLPPKSLEWPANVLWDLSEIAEADMGGTSGAIYSLGLAAASQGLASYKSNGVSSWVAACKSAMDAITKYGGAEPGDRTMLDALHTAHAEAIKLNGVVDLKALLQKTADAADRGAKSTAGMDARAGRASYVSREYTSDEDAGARAAAVWIQAICNTIADNM